MSLAKEKYRNFCATEETLPLFARDWWLDAAAGSNAWDVALCESGGQIRACLPYSFEKRYGLKILSTPPLTRSLGPWVKISQAKTAKRLAEQKKLLTNLIDQLPKFDLYRQNWHPPSNNWMPFYWRGFSQTTRYTYVIPNLSDEQTIYGGLLEKIRTDIRKAENKFQLRVRDDLPISHLWELTKLTFQRQGLSVPYSQKTLDSIDKACRDRNCGKLFIAEDEDGKQHAGVYIVWDKNSAYYLVGGSDPNLRNSGATSLCLWKGIMHAASVTKNFDFEGSMLEPVERFVRSFGAEQQTYFQVTKVNSRLLKIRKALLSIW